MRHLIVPFLVAFSSYLSPALHAQNTPLNQALGGYSQQGSLGIMRNTLQEDVVKAKIDAVEVELLTEHLKIVPGQSFKAGVRFKMDDEWHIYWRNPGDSGLPTEITWQLPEGYTAAELVYPIPQAIPMAPLLNYGYEGDVVLYSTLTAPEDAALGTLPLKAHVSWLMCKDICLPGEALLTTELTVVEKHEMGITPEPVFSFSDTGIQPDSGLIAEDVSQTQEAIILPIAEYGFSQTIRFIPFEEGVINDTAQSSYHSLADGRMALVLQKDAYLQPVITEISGLLEYATEDGTTHVESFTRHVAPTSEDAALKSDAELITPNADANSVGSQTATTPDGFLDVLGGGNGLQAQQAHLAGVTLGLALLFAFLGGLVLNLMPCVLPVLSLKVMSLISHANSGRAWVHGLVFTAGIVLMFWLLAVVIILLSSFGQAVGWGFQLQNPVFVAFVALVIFALSLNLFGVFEVGASLTRLDSPARHHGYVNTLMGGFLMVLVASPCTAPFMASAMGYAFTQSAATIFLIFTALGIGLAFPYLLFTLVPPLLRFMPKPGAWMVTFKQLLGFFMFATALWLFWLFSRVAEGIDVFWMILVLTFVAFAFWVWGRLFTVAHGRKAKGFALVTMALALMFYIFFTGLFIQGSPWYHSVSLLPLSASTSANHEAKTSEADTLHWQKWDAQAFVDAREKGYPVLLNFTADWCITCKVNERVAMSSDAFKQAVKSTNTVLFKGDWTRYDPEITAVLERFGRKGVPLYLYYAPDKEEPLILPQILTPSSVTEALTHD